MARFFDLPRELRDMVYHELITGESPIPTLGGDQWRFRFRRVVEPQSSKTGEYGCAYSTNRRPRTCANMLQCNRQVFAEMTEAIWRARRKDLIKVKLDCIAEDESFHYFTWLSIPLVATAKNVEVGKSRMMPAWADGMIRRYTGSLFQRSTTRINQLWIDVRLVGDRSGKLCSNNGSSSDRTSWAICAALKHILEKGPDLCNMKDTANETTMDELVLNVVSQAKVAEERYLPEDYPLMGLMEGSVHPKTVARELVNVWQKIWASSDFKSVYYHILLERIKRVRVCIDGETWSRRELRTELDKGQLEQQRIAARVGW
ncbi:hypothetical protein K504DRAFT_462627 [Pleomassaria siparia CBS 279.74]|uniref:Uncharacterized protein n=1 Tax=Pleomassaria siparia CBS 279.74 TaxID=1314801 RepID=A0A6G1KMX9_9PLEO|nr:hypothetical protein K504DRAFT_462627 [Pleomassaria siparia CBS 279.74]